MSCRYLIRSALVVAGLGVVAPAGAQESAEVFLRSLYQEPIYNPLEDGGADKLTGDALEALRTSETQSQEGEGVGCIDFVVTVSGQDYDGDAIRKTLAIEPAPADAEWPLEKGEARFLVSFTQAGEKTTLFYDLLEVDGAWRINDVANTAEEGWTMSQLCQ
ncbi:hypothetical protein [Antarcticirhabdus aurantiaca]|uniref:Uncharacterized protein n=1 Tax=Antarcticirhabdus aurantiaca TaxID=2606717 RepID=A0ACD4NTL9_9HYPH|nr:hypothetical protein [Antarcticirhabdus aurantiaca]WAJ30088.1 hypothetical protein OXU80_07745 [Jeongeuplla avenae]